MTYDVAIVGGGMVGATLAVALAPLNLRVALIEAIPHNAAAQPSFDERTTALSNGSRRILEAIGVWSALDAAATPIAKIHVSDQGRFGFARIDAREQGLKAMGYVVANRALGSALWSHLSSQETKVFCPAVLSGLTANDEAVKIEFAESGAKIAIDAKLIVAADGAQSVVRSAFGVAAEVRDYGQTAVITTVLPQRFHDNVAYERFTPEGPLALLPLDGGRCTLVLTLAKDAAHSALAWSDQEFLAEVQRRFGFRLGRFLKVGRRVPYPLSLTQSERTSAPRCVIIGNAAQGLHPVAGMGFNLGLRDVASLAELIAENARGAADARKFADPGNAQLLHEYDAWRRADRGGVIAFTDGLVRMFSNPSSVVARVRNLGLLAFDLLPPAKSALSRLSTGGGGRVPKLARGVALT
ncbi:MAG TPA: 2-octaprenyl-6-methoxyphenyl hydroxylase [Steroidobacteraceae bacterium]|nr:2-octaprenyl-6-methoxyphenyl hydroxylase [Steroidobacteraceae bacterium]